MGAEESQSTVLILTFHNDGTGTEKVASYDYVVQINDRTLERGRLENHRRKLGWKALVRRVVEGRHRCRHYVVPSSLS